jgi:hypothetical protein
MVPTGNSPLSARFLRRIFEAPSYMVHFVELAGRFLGWVFHYPLNGTLVHPSLTFLPEAVRELRKSFQGGLRHGHDRYRV